MCMIMIVGIWVFSLDKTIRSASEKGKEIDKSGSQIVQGVKGLKKDLPTLWQSLGAGISNILNSGENEIKISPGQSAIPSLRPSVSAPPQEKLPVE
ncbi:MAG: hypothetical protein UV34_C0002G0008 [Parcubacteria group bacterium GW2011_GWB1_42_6]|nr:MAG: hypothetical protein UV34_C0002G0008 [Parcubacteria group bacterium GW2011_GWB1_42_6]